MSPKKPEDQMLFYQITVKKFVDYLQDLSVSLSRDTNELPVFQPMPLGGWAEANEKFNSLQEDFAAKSKSLVHAIATQRKIHVTRELDYEALKVRFEKQSEEISQKDATLRTIEE